MVAAVVSVGPCTMPSETYVGWQNVKKGNRALVDLGNVCTVQSEFLRTNVLTCSLAHSPVLEYLN